MNMSIDLVQKESFEYSNNDWTKKYDCNLKNAKDIISLIEYLQDSYGEVEEILCLEKDKDNNTVLSYIEYDDFKEFEAGFNDELFNKYQVYKFCLKERHMDFFVDIRTNNLIVGNNEGTLGKKTYDPDKVNFYEDEYGNIVKYDDNKKMVYTFDSKLKKWVKRRDLRRRFYDYDNGYTLIDCDEQTGLKRSAGDIGLS